jgi:hypothetical protein
MAARKKSESSIRSHAAVPVPPDAVRVWRGFRLATSQPADFLQQLGSIFIPATAVLQRLYGLTAYLPTVLPTNKPGGVPDEIAIVFYKTQQAYTDTSLIVAGRAYSALHKTVFAFPASLSDFPAKLKSAVIFDQPYYLFDEEVDWQQGFSQVFVGARPQSSSQATFQSQFRDFFLDQQNRPAAGCNGGLFCVSADYVVYWEHWESEAASLHGRISDLPQLATRVVLQPHKPHEIEPSISAHYKGMTDVESKSLNILFPR